MVYQLMGMSVPKQIRDKLAKQGADFSEYSDYFPMRQNSKACHKVTVGQLGLIEEKPPAKDSELIEPHKKKKETENPIVAELER